MHNITMSVTKTTKPLFNYIILTVFAEIIGKTLRLTELALIRRCIKKGVKTSVRLPSAVRCPPSALCPPTSWWGPLEGPPDEECNLE